MSEPCGCCDGIKPATPKSIANRPGLAALAYRVGTHSSFLETMLARLSTSQVSRPTGVYSAQGQPILQYYSTLGGLNTRDPSDFSIALLDAWATVADVLTFYQERIANEGYVRTATERRSIVELARLIGYVPKPGVSASVYLAYTLQNDAVTTIDAGARSQSVPGPGQLPQSFETSDPLDARAVWNDLQPRMSRPQRVPDTLKDGHRIFLQGIATKLRPGDPLLVRATPDNVYRVCQVKPDAAAGRTTIVVQPWSQAPVLADTIGGVQSKIDGIGKEIDEFLNTKPPQALVAFLTSIQKDVLTPLEAALKSSAAAADLDAAVYRAVRSLTSTLLGATAPDPTWTPKAIDLWNGLSAILTDPQVKNVHDSEQNHKVDPSLAAPADQEHFQHVKAALDDLEKAMSNLQAKQPPTSPRDPNNRDMVANFVVALQTAIERLRIEWHGIDGAAFAATVDSLISEFTDIVRNFPASAIWHGLDAIKAVYLEQVHLLAAPGNPNVAIVQDVLDAPGGISTIPVLDDPGALAEKIRAAIDLNQFDPKNMQDNNPAVNDLIDEVFTALDEMVVSLQFGPIRSDIRAIIERYQDPSGAGISGRGPKDTDVDTAIAGRAIKALQGALADLDPHVSLATVVSDLQLKLTALRTELSLAQAGGYPRVEPWLSSLVSDFDAAVQRAAAALGKDTQGYTAAFGSPTNVSNLLQQLLTNPSAPPPDSAHLKRALAQTFSRDDKGGDRQFATADVSTQILANFDPQLKTSLYPALANVAVSVSSAPVVVQALRAKAAPFGAAAPMKNVLKDGIIIGSEEWLLSSATPPPEWNVLTLDAVHDQIVPESWVVIERLDRSGDAALQVHRILSVATVTEANFGLTGKATRLTLDGDWLDADDSDLSAYRKATVYAQSETLALAQEPYDADVQSDTIELDGLYDGLKSGRWVIVSGERTDIPATGGVMASELAMIRSVKQDYDPNLSGDKLHSYLGLSVALNYSYKRASVTVHGNVVRATHGETRNEVLGSGSGAQGLQQFALKQPPLTFVSAPNPRGAESTLEVRANNVLWNDVDTLGSLGPLDRDYVTLTDDNDQVSVVFGNGVHGARLPTGQENVTASYRFGIGQVGNVDAGQISLLVTRPLGVKAVINPLPATGGTDRESRDQARRNLPISVTALDRLVSVQDFEDFARTFAGIGKASAQRFASDGAEFVHLTIAGVEDIPIDVNSDLMNNLLRSLQLNGDPLLPVVVALRELLTVVMSAEIRVTDGYLWEDVSDAVRQALLAAFGFDARELGQTLWLSEVYAVIQGVNGVEYVGIKTLGRIPQYGSDEKIITFDEISTLIEGKSPTDKSQGIANNPPAEEISAELARAANGRVLPAQIALMTADVPDTIILREISS
ncbi:MAG: putative baseplate assembly protein [Candidatus Limnocylindrales bacterium]